MKSNFLLKYLMVFVFLQGNFRLIVGMTDNGSSKRSLEYEGLIRSPSPLIGLVSLQIAKQAAQIYDKQDYAAFINYVNLVPEEVKIGLLFCALINFLNRSDIFITQLKAIYK